MAATFHRQYGDWLGIGVSIACALHCALLPLAVSSLPILGVNIIGNQRVEFFMLALAFLVGSLALAHGYRRHHHRLLPFWLFTGGICCLLAKDLVPALEYGLLPPAVAGIVSGHLVNLRLSHPRERKNSPETDGAGNVFPISKTKNPGQL